MNNSGKKKQKNQQPILGLFLHAGEIAHEGLSNQDG
jgi:hypothetical protein